MITLLRSSSILFRSRLPEFHIAFYLCSFLLVAPVNDFASVRLFGYDFIKSALTCFLGNAPSGFLDITKTHFVGIADQVDFPV